MDTEGKKQALPFKPENYSKSGRRQFFEKEFRLLEQLSDAEIREVIEFMRKKISAKRDAKHRKFNFHWAGGLKDLKEKYSSVELQHKALEWR